MTLYSQPNAFGITGISQCPIYDPGCGSRDDWFGLSSESPVVTDMSHIAELAALDLRSRGKTRNLRNAEDREKVLSKDRRGRGWFDPSERDRN
ncbi:MAG TPA: hypothetical protein PLE60_00150 [Candidatus Latescibacteria bacterium]|nr:hypothetical protein [Candidatus Latescibacterota bacterium]